MPKPPPISKTIPRKQATATPLSKAPAGRKGSPKATEPPKQSPAVKVLAPGEWPRSHPLVGKVVAASAYLSVEGKTKIVKGKVEAGDQTVIKIGPMWYFTSSLKFT